MDGPEDGTTIILKFFVMRFRFDGQQVESIVYRNYVHGRVREIHLKYGLRTAGGEHCI
jgi:hypothetical protein